MKIYGVLLISCGILYSTVLFAQNRPVTYDVILCLDDRLTVEGQIQRDRDIILLIFREFEGFIRNQRLFINSQDAFRLLIAPQRGTSKRIESLALSASINLANISIAQKRRAMDDFRSSLDETLIALYDAAYLGPDTRMYNGANVWRYFTGQYQNIMQKGTVHRIFILTDGHIDFEDQEHVIRKGNQINNTEFIHKLKQDIHWRDKLVSRNIGILPCNLNLQESEVYVLEINPKSDAYFEAEILQWVWNEWLRAMGAEKVQTMQRTPLLPDLFNSYNTLPITIRE